MSICFHPDLFDAERFQSLQKGDILRRIRASIIPGRNFPATVDGYDILSFRVEEEPYRPIGSIVDYLAEQLPEEDAANPDLAEMTLLLRNLTERHGNLARETDSTYLGYLTAGEVRLLRGQLERCGFETAQTMNEKTAMVKILAIAERRGTGLIFSQM
ncbi:MAG: hypothetical protein JW748_06350 [Anaerolineales bacterium]|nr:hypothetical protein [Anaerolineales bacterium]